MPAVLGIPIESDRWESALTQATREGVQGRLLYRGAAWSLMRSDGVLPENAPPLGATIDTDLADHGFALLRAAMALRAQAGSSGLTEKAFERAGNAFESLVRNALPDSADRGFRRMIAATAYHLAGFSAVAYSLFSEMVGDLNLTPGEVAVMRLVLRDLDGLRTFVRGWLNDEAHGDDRIAAELSGENADVDEILTPQSRRGHFAMGVGLEAGLSIDAMADDLGALIDRADAASLPGNVDELTDALAGLSERLLVMRPFTPDKRNALPANRKTILKQWVSGAEVSEIGPHNMKLVEEAFTYRLVWALEAIRTRRVSLGWSPDIIPGGGAASLETGVPHFMMSMLIRAGLPSRRAAIAAIRSSNPLFVTPAEMRAWLESDEITAVRRRRLADTGYGRFVGSLQNRSSQRRYSEMVDRAISASA